MRLKKLKKRSVLLHRSKCSLKVWVGNGEGEEGEVDGDLRGIREEE